MSFPRYPEYKDSGVEWLGEVPALWGVVPMLAVARERDERNEGMVEDNLLSLSYGQIIRKDMSSNDGLLPESFETYQIVYPGDIVFRLTDLQNDQRSLRTARVDERGIITSAYVATEPRGIDSKYFSYLLRAFDQTKVFYSMGGGLRQGMKFSDLRRMPVLVPSAGEQRSIAEFLDAEVAKIDGLVSEQEKLIALLKEKRQAVISHAVTKGLDPNVPMRDSGIEWLGEVPAHWNVSKVKHLIKSIGQGWSPQCEGYPVDGDDEWGVLKVGCVNGGVFSPIENKRLPDGEQPIPDLGLAAGDLLVSRANTRELVGSAAVVDRAYPNLMLCDKLYRLRVLPESMMPEFLSLYLGSNRVRGQIELMATGASSSMLNIAQSTILDLFVAVPTLEDQRLIIEEVGDLLGELSALTKEALAGIDLLRERRAALISAAVTGKIDVRNSAISHVA